MVTHDPLIGRDLDGYRIEELLGHGGMGRVYRGLDLKLKRYAAIKVLDAKPNERKKYEQRFYKEAQAIAKLKHPNIVSVYRFNEIETIYYMAMEYIDGADLRWVLHNYANEGKFIDYETLYTIIEQLASALDYAHKNGVIHRDIKPSNVMIGRDGKAILTDFGLALDVDEGSIGEIFGSPHYIAPEQAVNSAQAVPQTDLYSLGVILYEMLTGSIPYGEGSVFQIAMAHISSPLPNPKEANPDLHEAFIPVLEKILAKEPSERYQTGAALSQALKGAFREAEQALNMHDKTSMVKPTERIAKAKIPLPEPVVSVETKSPTQVISVKETKFLSPQEGGRPSKKANPFVLIASILLIATIALAAYFYSQGNLDFLLQAVDNPAIALNATNTRIEGYVESFSTSNGWADLRVFGVDLQISRAYPLYETIEIGDVIMIEGYTVRNNGVYRFERIDSASRNGEPIEIEESEN